MIIMADITESKGKVKVEYWRTDDEYKIQIMSLESKGCGASTRIKKVWRELELSGREMRTMMDLATEIELELD